MTTTNWIVTLITICTVLTNADQTEKQTSYEAAEDYYNDDYESGLLHEIESREHFDERIPQPSPLIVPGYNLPDNLFNNGKPFYMDKDPQTGSITFNNQAERRHDEDVADILNHKDNIDRKDSAPTYYSHRTNSLGNIYDLGADSMSKKYDYPLVSGSYANTKIQGINKNSLVDQTFKATTYRPYFDVKRQTTKTESTVDSKLDSNKNKEEAYGMKLKNNQEHTSTERQFTEPSTEEPSTTTKRFVKTTTPGPLTTTTRPKITTKASSLFDDFFSIFNTDRDEHQYEDRGEFYDEIYTTTTTLKPLEERSTMGRVESVSETTVKIPYRVMERNKTVEVVGITATTTTTTTTTTTKPTTTKPTTTKPTTTKPTPKPYVETKRNPNPTKSDSESTQKKETTKTNAQTTTESIKPSTNSHTPQFSVHYDEYYDDTDTNKEYNEIRERVEMKLENQPKPTTTKPYVTTNTLRRKNETRGTTEATKKADNKPVVTSMPVDVVEDNSPIVALTQNLREKLSSERVAVYDSRIKPGQAPVTDWRQGQTNQGAQVFPDVDDDETPEFIPLKFNKKFETSSGSVAATPAPLLAPKPNDLYNGSKHSDDQPLLVPNKSSVRIPPNKNTIAFVVGNHQNVHDGHFIGSAIQEVPYNAGVYFKQPVGKKEVMKTNPEIVHGSYVANQAVLNGPPETLAMNPLKIPQVVEKEKRPFYVDEDAAQHKPSNFIDRSDYKLSENRLQLSSKPVYHQLPSDLTPPKDIPSPWDTHNKPVNRPSEHNKRKTQEGTLAGVKLPNILPQFRPTSKVAYDGHLRQPLLDRPYRPVSYFNKYHPMHHVPQRRISEHHFRMPEMDIRRVVEVEPEANRRILNFKDSADEFLKPPQVPQLNRQTDDVEISTLQMLQFNKLTSDDSVKVKEVVAEEERVDDRHEQVKVEEKEQENKTVYVVYPLSVNTYANEETTKKFFTAFNDYKQSIDDKLDANAPILKPKDHTSNFPYSIVKPDVRANVNEVKHAVHSYNDMNSKTSIPLYQDNQWNEVSASQYDANETKISATLKTKESPIAFAYTPTEKNDVSVSYVSPIIPERDDDTRKGSVESIPNKYQMKNEVTVNAIMHTHPQFPAPSQSVVYRNGDDENGSFNFQAPFHASLNVDAPHEGWAVISNRRQSTDESEPSDADTVNVNATKFDIENFKPQLFGGFKPIYNTPDNSTELVAADSSERQE